jgi:hypothetical protein
VSVSNFQTSLVVSAAIGGFLSLMALSS